MKKVLWISRHKMDEQAYDELKDIYGDIEVDTKPIVFPKSGGESYQLLKQEAEGYDIIGFVSPAQLTAELLRTKNKLNKDGFFIISIPAWAGGNGQRKFEYHHLERFKL